MMDTPQSNALLKKLIAAVERVGHYLEILRQDFNQRADAIRRDCERNQEEKRKKKREPVTIKFTNEEIQSRNAEQTRQYSVQKSIRNATRGAVVAAAVYAGIAGWQTYEIRRNFRIGQRAFMKITAEPGQSVDIIPPALWTARFTNVGKTPAFQIEAEFQFQFLKKEESPVFDYETKPSNGFNGPLMWPDDKDAIAVFRAYYPAGTHARKDIGISAEELALFNNGEAWIAKNGRITYEDILGIIHVTTFCAASTVSTMDVRKRQEFRGMHICIAYNSVDTN